jgi:hypothetical protein
MVTDRPSSTELLGALASPAACASSTSSVHPATAWAQSGAMALTGRPGRPLIAPDRLILGLYDLAGWIGELTAAAGSPVTVDPLALLGERAALQGLSSTGDISCGRYARMLPCRDGWIAASLPRSEDWRRVPAWLESPCPPHEWSTVAEFVRVRDGAELIARASLLGLAIGELDAFGPSRAPAVVARRIGDARSKAPALSDALVVELASLWAGPLTAQLLQHTGARVIKVESVDRPDGARRGSPAFFSMLHAGQESVALDLATPPGRTALRRLVLAADIVIEGSRPRALRQLGIDAHHALATGNTQLWLSITGYGWSGEEALRIGFGDDAAVAGGLAARDHDGPCFCADAVSDPATGITAAAALLAAYGSGRWHLDVALARVAAVLAGPTRRTQWLAGEPGEAVAPRASPRQLEPRPLGADTDEVLRELASRPAGGDKISAGR